MARGVLLGLSSFSTTSSFRLLLIGSPVFSKPVLTPLTEEELGEPQVDTSWTQSVSAEPRLTDRDGVGSWPGGWALSGEILDKRDSVEERPLSAATPPAGTPTQSCDTASEHRAVAAARCHQTDIYTDYILKVKGHTVRGHGIIRQRLLGRCCCLQHTLLCEHFTSLGWRRRRPEKRHRKSTL